MDAYAWWNMVLSLAIVTFCLQAFRSILFVVFCACVRGIFFFFCM